MDIGSPMVFLIFLVPDASGDVFYFSFHRLACLNIPIVTV